MTNEPTNWEEELITASFWDWETRSATIAQFLKEHAGEQLTETQCSTFLALFNLPVHLSDDTTLQISEEGDTYQAVECGEDFYDYAKDWDDD
jgi:hypothetical protein